jgi:hypothetical protein
MARARVAMKIGASIFIFCAIVVVAIVVVDAFHEHQAESDMTCAVSSHWICPIESITIQSLGAATYKFDGCGHGATYYCKMPAEGCFLEHSNEVLNMSACRQ